MNYIANILVISLVTFNIQAEIIHSIFGDVDESNPVVHKLIDSKAMQRLKHIDQSGPEGYFSDNFPMFSRYDHSVGVYALLKRYNVSSEEQIAGLMHDASHTVFSHLADLIFQHGSDRKDSYQDNIHNWFLSKMGVEQILAPYNLTLENISPKNPNFHALEQPFPDMNADRIEYNLHTGLVFSDISDNDVREILDSLRYENNKWYFTDIRSAKKFAKLSTYYTKVFWGNPHNVALYTAAAAAVQHAINTKLINSDELHFGIDEEIVAKLRQSRDPILQELVKVMSKIEQYYTSTGPENYDIYQPVKMRGIDPLVMQQDKLYRLSKLSIDFKNELDLTQQYAQRGVYIKFRNISNPTVLSLISKANT